MAHERADIGKNGEVLAAEHLRNKGFEILDMNWRRPWGELDVVARKGDTVHFIEVKTSTARLEGFAPYLRANKAKMQKVTRTARSWLVAHRYPWNQEWQLDIIGIAGIGLEQTVEHFENI